MYAERQTKIVPAPVLPWVKKHALALCVKYKPPAPAYKIVELGCGWGGVLISLSRLYPQAHLHGYEMSLCPYLVTKARIFFKGRKIQISATDFFTVDFSDADIIYCYLSPHHMAQLIPQFQSMKPGAVIISCSFAIPGWTPVEVRDVPGVVKIPVYVYQRP